MGEVLYIVFLEIMAKSLWMQYKYEARGVYVFRGEIKANNESKKYLSNVNREFLFFEKGYKVTSGVCRQSSPSFKQPPQYSQPPQ